MQIPLQITFRDFEHSDAIEKAVREKAEKLDQFAQIMSCRVVVEMINKHQHKGTLYQVSIDLTVPGKEIVVSRDHGIDHSHEDIYVAIRDSFNAARRRLEDQVRLASGHRSKPHPETEHGFVDRLFIDEGYGFIRTADDDDIYFQSDSLTNSSWDSLNVDDAVRFKRQIGEKGAFAVHVTPVKK
jgi:cold shock CspA family protein